MPFKLTATLPIDDNITAEEIREFLSQLPLHTPLLATWYGPSNDRKWTLQADLPVEPKAMGKVGAIIQESRSQAVSE